MQGGQWVQWVILLIGVAVWVFTHLLKAGNDQQKQRRQQQQPQGGGAARRPAGDIDRFLEEIQRRRRDADKKRPTIESAPPPVMREPPQRPVRPPPMPQTPRRVERPVERAPLVPSPPRRRPPELPRRPRQAVPAPVEVVVLEEVKPSEATAGIAEAHVAPSERVAYLAPTVSAVQAPTASAKALVELLRTREGLKSAVLLNEVIGPPLCKRPRKV